MWRDPRTPEWQGVVKGKIVRIYDMAGYEQAKRDYPDVEDATREGLSALVQTSPPVKPANNRKPPFAKQKSQARYNWVHPDIAKEIAG